MKIFLGGPLETFGDVCLISTLVRNLKLREGEKTEITVVTDAQYIDILKDNPDIAQLWPGQARNFFDLYTKSCYDRFDKVYFPLMTYHPHTMWHHDPQAHYHLVDMYAKKCDNLQITDRRTFVYPSEHDKQVVEQVLGEYAQLNGKIPVAMHIQSPVSSKSWGIKNFTKLAQTLEQRGLVVMQVGGGGDEKIQTPFIVDLRGRFTPRQTAWALSKAWLYVGIDSGPAYLADAMGVPSVILYGATTHIQAGPLSSLSYPVEPVRMQQFPCGPGFMTCSTHCQIGKPCIESLDRDEITNLVLGILKNIVDVRTKAPEPVKETVPA